MKQNSNKLISVKGCKSSDSDQQCAPGFYKVLCLGLVTLMALLGLFKLGQALQERSTPSTDIRTAGPQSSSDLSPPDGSPSAFRSQRRSDAPTADPNDEKRRTDSEHSRVDGPLQRLQSVLALASPTDRETAATLRRFAASGSMAELRALASDDVESLAKYLTESMSEEDLGVLLDRYLGFSVSQAVGRPELKETLMGIYDAVSEHYSTEVRPTALMITDQARADGRVTGQTHALPSGTDTVYAVFENDWSLAGLSQVLAVWRDPNDDSMVFTQFEPIRQGSAYNYVWLNVKEGWPAGRYKVELFHPEAQSLLLASESFSVR